MPQYIELTPTYGRDYRSAKEAVAAFKSGQDFQGLTATASTASHLGYCA